MNAARMRPGRSSDLPEILRIYNHYVRHTHHTFDTRELRVADRRSWLEEFSPAGARRLLVAELGSGLAGYALSGPLRPKPAYDSSVETTVYLDPDRTGQGIGGALYGALLDALIAQESLHRAYAVIALPNPGSITFHERLGFRHVGTFHEVGRKFGRWWDVGWYEKDLSGPAIL